MTQSLTQSLAPTHKVLHKLDLYVGSVNTQKGELNVECKVHDVISTRLITYT